MQKWEHRPVLVNGTYIEPIPIEQGGKLNWPHQEYPKMLYKADAFDGGHRISEMITVHTANEEAMQLGRGYSVTQQQAIDRVAANQLELAKLAANRAYNERLMSANARAEAAAVDEATMQHLPEIKEKPKRKYVKKTGAPHAT